MAATILAAIAIGAGWLGSETLARDGLPWISGAIAVSCAVASIGVLAGHPLGRRLAGAIAVVMTIVVALGLVALAIAMALSVNNPDRQWRFMFGYLVLVAATGFVIWSLRASRPNRRRGAPLGLFVSAPVVIGTLVAALLLGGDSSARARALPEFQLAPADAVLVSEGGRPDESGILGPVSAWAGRTYQTDRSPAAVVAFYERELESRGWQPSLSSTGNQGELEWQGWRRDGFDFQVQFPCGLQPPPGCAEPDHFGIRIYVP